MLKLFENPKIPLLGPNVYSLQFWGLLLPNDIIQKYMYMFAHIFVIIFTVTEYVDVWYVKNDIKLLLHNLKITMLATVSVTKIITIIIWQKSWRAIIDYVTRTDVAARDTEDVIKIALINKYTKYCRMITYTYCILTYFTGATVIFQPVLKYFISSTYRDNVKAGKETYLEIVSSWVPFDKTTGLGYIGASLIQAFATIYASGWITSFDTNSISIMVFFRGQLELLKIDCQKMFGSEDNSIEESEALKRLKSIQRRHAAIMKYFQLFNSCLSPIMLLYMIVCSIMLCVTAFEINVESNPMQKFMIAEYLAFCVTQLFLYCWHSNDVYHISLTMMRGPYEGFWWSYKGLRKDLYILTAQLSTNFVFTAGPFAKLTVPTLLRIIKGAYSYYTLLSATQKK